jgi:hypothetical protein
VVREPEVSTPLTAQPTLDMILSQFHPPPFLTTYLPKIHVTKSTNPLVAEPDSLTSVIPKPTNEHIPQPVLFAFHPHNIFPQNFSYYLTNPLLA